MYVYPNAEEISKIRKKLGLTMQQLSRKANLPENAILRIESRQTVRTNHLRAREIARALNCDVREIFDIPNKNDGGAV